MPYYTLEQVKSLYRQEGKAVRELRELMYKFALTAQEVQDVRTQEQLRHGAARRVHVLAQCISNIYQLFPPNLERPLDSDVLSNVQINLHAYVINLWGVFDNWAWAFVFQHGLEKTDFRDPRQVGLFKPRLMALLPRPLRDYLETEHFRDWQAKYLTSYRDALAHRIPLYIPPAIWTRAENDRYHALTDKIRASISAQQWERVETLRAEQNQLGIPCFAFLHSFSRDEPPAPINLHTQVLSDSAAIVEFGALFLQHWRERARSP